MTVSLGYSSSRGGHAPVPCVGIGVVGRTNCGLTLVAWDSQGLPPIGLPGAPGFMLSDQLNGLSSVTF